MKWYKPEFDYTKWHRTFCFLPQRIEDYIVWFHWVEVRWERNGTMYFRFIKVKK